MIWDHPRACGENSLKVSTRQHRRGSPPRMRGKPHGRPNPKATVRITPAHAGKTNCGNDSTCGLQDHPRACGENAPSCVIDALATRITPAHAGKTHLCRLQNRCNKDHPRACGENILHSLYIFPNLGSLPRMRGKLLYIFIALSAFGITPAHAGKTTPLDFAYPCTLDHPRACGENLTRLQC